MKILHLIVDHQVIERTLSLYEEVFPECNDVIVFSDAKEYKHLYKHKTCVRISRKDVKKKGKNYNFDGIDYIIAHFLTLEMIDFIGYAPKEIHVSWEIYGYDLYDQFLAPLGYKLEYVDGVSYLSKLTKILYKLSLLKVAVFLRDGDKSHFSFIRKKYFEKITNRLNSVCGSKCNAKVLENYSGLTFGFFQTFCYSLKETLGSMYGMDFYESSNILIGNSCSLTNNHLYALNYIKDFEIGDSYIIMPLSYGGIPKYKEDVIKKYSDVFPNKTRCILDYMPLSDYNKIFLNIKTIVVASWREESFGTIIMGLYLGLKIIMSIKSPVYLSLIEEGFRIFAIEDVTNTEFVRPLSLQDKDYNRCLLLKNYSEDKFIGELKRQFV